MFNWRTSVNKECRDRVLVRRYSVWPGDRIGDGHGPYGATGVTAAGPRVEECSHTPDCDRTFVSCRASYAQNIPHGMCAIHACRCMRVLHDCVCNGA